MYPFCFWNFHSSFQLKYFHNLGKPWFIKHLEIIDYSKAAQQKYGSLHNIVASDFPGKQCFCYAITLENSSSQYVSAPLWWG